MDYKDLIIVGYKGGYGGDIISTLIEQNFNANTNISLFGNPALNRYSYTPQSIACFKGLNTVLNYFHKCLTVRDVKRINNEMKFENEVYGLVALYNFCWDELPDLYNFCWDELPANIIENLAIYYRHKYECLLPRPRVINTHYVEPTPKFFSEAIVETIFPGSKKIRLTCESKYVDYFNALCFYKLDQTIKKEGEIINDSRVTIEDLSSPDRFVFLKEKLEDFIDVDVGRLFFEEDIWVDRVGEQLSDILKTKIVLDKNFISNVYKPANFKILEKMLGAGYLANSIETNLEGFLKYATSKQPTEKL